MSSAFLPDPLRARREAAELDRRLVSSLDHLASACRIDGPALAALTRFKAGVDAGRKAAPGHYGIHFELLDAIADGSGERIGQLFDLLASLPLVDGQRITAGRPEGLPGGLFDIITRSVDADADRPLGFVDFDRGKEQQARHDLAEASAAVDAADPALGGELAALVREFVLMESASDIEPPFTAASTFFLWGGLFVAPQSHGDVLDLAETLVHETGHLLLSALAAEEPVVLNDPSARYRSPLRSDPRPMEGVFHAVFVLAREILFHRAVADSSDFDGVQRAASSRAIADKMRRFRDGLGVVDGEAELTPLGRSLIDDAAAFVEGGKISS